MADVHTEQQRSYNMSRIRGRWTVPEKRIHNYLKGRKIRHKMHPDIYGRPDILLKDATTLVFIDGCFWHKCPLCYVEPKSNVTFWRDKIEKNVRRDKKIKKALRKQGWNVIRLWEHELKKNPVKTMLKLEKVLHD